MTSRVQRIAPWQATKLFTLLYFIIGLIISVLLALFVLAAPQAAAEGEITLGFVFIFPVMYGLIALIFVVINLIVDLLYFAVDPRLRVEKAGGH